MSLLRTAVRASVAARVVGNVQRRQRADWATQDAARSGTPAGSAAPVPGPAAPAEPQMLLDQLAQLGRLRDSGVLTAEEFDAQKQRLLGG